MVDFAPSADAGIYNAVEILIGEKAAGMGGAFTAVADDPSALYYNPAGIVQIPFASMSASANVAHFKTREGKFFLRDDEKLTSFDFIPDFWGATTTTFLGKVGFSIVIPESEDFEFHENYSNVSSLGVTWNTARYDVVFQSDTYLIGPSYAFSLRPDLSMGLSLYLLYNNFSDRVASFLNSDLLLVENNRFAEGSGIGVTGRLGVLYQWTDRVRVGAMFRPPARIHQEVDVNQVSYLCAAADTVASCRSSSERTVSYDREIPFSSTVGIAYLHPDRKYTLAADLSYSGSARYDQEDIQREVVLESVINGNIGLEYLLSPQVPLRVGIFSDRSAAPEVRDVDASQPTRIDKYGMTLSSGLIQQNSTLIAGIKYSMGEGYGTARDYSDPAAPFRKEAYTQTETAFFISGTYMF